MSRYALLCGLLLLLVPIHSDAQSFRAWGVKAGLTSAGQGYDYSQYDNSSDRRLGFCVAFYVEWFDGAPFSISTELGYTQRGTTETFDVFPVDLDAMGPTTISNRLDYLSLPILAALRVEAPTVSPFVEFGPRVDLLLGYSHGVDNFDPVFGRSKAVALGATVGIGLTHKTLFSRPVRIEARYNWDLNKSYSTEFLEVSNNAVDILVGMES